MYWHMFNSWGWCKLGSKLPLLLLNSRFLINSWIFFEHGSHSKQIQNLIHRLNPPLQSFNTNKPIPPLGIRNKCTHSTWELSTFLAVSQNTRLVLPFPVHFKSTFPSASHTHTWQAWLAGSSDSPSQQRLTLTLHVLTGLHHHPPPHTHIHESHHSLNQVSSPC